MNRILPIAISILLAASIAELHAQNITSIHVSPPSPPPATNVDVVVTAIFPNMGCAMQGYQVSTTGNSVTVNVNHQAGMLPAMCTTTDSVPMGTFSPGIYYLTYNITDPSYTTVYETAYDTFVVGCPDPAADFIYSPNNYTVSFTNMGMFGNQYEWDFGDNDTSHSENPVHTYPDTGTYQVCLITTNSCGADTVCKPVQVTCPIPDADFQWNISQTTPSGAQVQFVNFSANDDSASWDFGVTSATSNTMNPTFVYTDTGTFNACLIALSECGADTLCKPVSIPCSLDSAGFTYSSVGLQFSFDDQSSGVYDIVWDFGDGDTSHGQNPSHTYSDPGFYEVCLVVSNYCKSDTVCQTITAGCPEPEAAFDVTADSLTLTFSNQTYAGDSYQWDFGDGNSDTSANPVHTYDSAGTYYVCLIATSNCGSDTVCDSVQVGCPLPAAHFTYTKGDFQAEFTNGSTGADTYFWDFDDGNTDTVEHPVHHFPSDDPLAVFEVCLTASNDCGSTTYCEEVYFFINSVPVNMNAAGGITLYPNPAGENLNYRIEDDASEYDRVDIYSAAGSRVYSAPIRSRSGVLTVNNLPPGYYSAVFKGPEDTTRHLKFLKK